MGDKFENWMNLDLPDDMYLSQNIRELARRHAEMTPDEYVKTMVGVIAGNVMEMEERLIALEKQAGIEPRKPRPLSEWS